VSKTGNVDSCITNNYCQAFEKGTRIMKKYIIVVDRGSTNVKAVVFNTKAEVVLTTTYANPAAISPKPGWVELDLEANWKSVAGAIKKIFNNDVKPEEVLGVMITGQGNGVTFIDKQGKSTSISSLDIRGVDMLNEWKADGRFPKAVELTGTVFNASSAMPALAWLKKNARDVYDSIDTVMFIIDWMNYKLTGVIGTQWADVSGSGMMKLRDCKCDYAYDVLDLFGLEEIKTKLPPIQMCHEMRGTVTKEAAELTGLTEGTPVLSGIYDIAAFPYGIGSMNPREVVHAIGTWGISCRPAARIEECGISTLYHPVPGYYVTGMGDSVAGCCLDFIMNTLCDHEKQEAEKKGMTVYQYVEDMIADREPTGILFQPYPFGNMFSKHAGAGFTGIRSWHTKADILRAVYEGIVMGYKTYCTLLADCDKCDVHWLIGGGAKSKVFGQMFADIFGVTVKIPVTSEITARGAVLNALVGLGVCKDHEEATIPVGVKAEYTPDPEKKEFYAKKFEAFGELSQALMGVWAKLNTL